MKHHLDKSSKKFPCPKCNKKRFVRFVETETNNYLDELYGRCDRESSCGYFEKPEIDIKTNPFNTITTLQQKVVSNNKPTQNTSYHTAEIVQQSLRQYHNNNLFLFLKSYFSQEQIENTFRKYQIGTSKAWLGATVFWQIDNLNKIRAGKIILFDKNTSKRVKEPYPHITWAHSKLKYESFNLKQCLFGLHLVKDSGKIAITESEKTAVIMSLFLPEYTWMSTGSKQNFKNEILTPIKHKEIVVFPDKSEFNDWSNKATELNKFGYSIKVSDYIEKQNFEVGTDLADVYISLNNMKPSFEELSTDEKEVVRLSKVNSDLLQLIKTFELCDSFDNLFNIEKLKQFV